MEMVVISNLSNKKIIKNVLFHILPDNMFLIALGTKSLIGTIIVSLQLWKLYAITLLWQTHLSA